MAGVDKDVTVVGGGIGGMTVSLLLARAGASVTMLERGPGPTAVGAGILLQANGLAVLDGLGLRHELEARGRVFKQSTVRTEAGKVISRLDTPDFGAGIGHMVAIRRSALHEVLFDALEKEPQVACRFDCTAVAADSSGTVDIDWNGQRSTVAADLVVGADGLHSRVREHGAFECNRPPAVENYIRGLVTNTEPLLAGEYWTPLGLFGGSQVDSETLYFYAAALAPDVAAAVARRDLVDLRRAWSATLPLAGRVLSLVSSFDDLLVNEAVRVDCATWRDGRLVLIGDAAHAMSPTLGQGANSALVDAAVLTEELASDSSMSASLERYVRRRLRRVKTIQNRAQTVARASALQNPVARQMRDAGLRVIGRVPGSSRRLATALQQEPPARLARAVRALGEPRSSGEST